MRVLIFDSVDSTQEIAKKIIIEKKNIQEFLGIMALEQKNGKGRRGANWFSSYQESFIFSLILPYSSHSHHLPLLLSAAAIETIRKKMGLLVSLKWPNDLYFQNQKIGGALAENYEQFTIAGIGINLNQKKFPPEIEKKASSLFQITQKNISPIEFLNDYLPILFHYYETWQKNPKQFLQEKIQPLYCWIKEKIVVQFLDHQEIGILREIDEDGFLIFENQGNIKKIASGEVSLWLQG